MRLSTPASLVCAAMLAGGSARAELIGDGAPRRPFVGATMIWEPNASSLRLQAQPWPSAAASTLAAVSLPPVLLSPGVAGPASFRWKTYEAPLLMTWPSLLRRGITPALCLGAACDPVRSVVGDLNAAGANASARLITSIAIGAAALALFSSPVPKKTRALAFSMAPMFACGGAGLELRAGWR